MVSCEEGREGQRLTSRAGVGYKTLAPPRSALSECPCCTLTVCVCHSVLCSSLPWTSSLWLGRAGVWLTTSLHLASGLPCLLSAVLPLPWWRRDITMRVLCQLRARVCARVSEEENRWMSCVFRDQICVHTGSCQFRSGQVWEHAL